MRKSVTLFVSIACLGLVGCGHQSQKVDEPILRQALEDSEPKVDLLKAAKLNIELGLTYLNEGYVERAKTKLNHALKLAPQLSDAHYAMGYYYEKVGENQKAEEFYRKGISLNRDGGKEHNNYGTFLCRQKRYRESEKEFLLALKDPSYVNTAEVLENAGLCVMAIPDANGAARYFERALQHDPKRPSTLLELAILRWQQGRHLEAKEYYARYQRVGQPNQRSLLLGIEIAKSEGDRNRVASLTLMLNAASQQ